MSKWVRGLHTDVRPQQIERERGNANALRGEGKVPIDFNIFMNSSINGIFLFGVMTLLLTVSYIVGFDEIDDFNDHDD